MNKIDKDRKIILESIDNIINLSKFLCYLPDDKKDKKIKHLKKMRNKIYKEKYKKYMKEEWLDEVRRWEE